METTVNAIMAYAETVRSICTTNGCPQLASVSPSAFHSQLSTLNFTYPGTFSVAALRGRRIAFDMNGDLISSGYTFYNYNSRSGSYAFEQVRFVQSHTMLMAEDFYVCKI